MTSWRPERIVTLSRADAVAGDRAVAVEAPVAIEVNGLGYAVMMMTPVALVEFATGFLLTERLADSVADILAIDPFETAPGWIVRVTLAERCAARIHDRVRHRSSDTACGLCGIAGLDQITRAVSRAPAPPALDRTVLFAALAAIGDHQPLNRRTGALHAAAWCDPQGAVRRAFEDVGRHNALDKLIGALAIAGDAPQHGFLLVTSRISFEMVDKALVARASLLIGISAPTSMGVDHARAHGLTLVALARPDAMLVFNDPWQKFAGGSGGGT